MLILVTGGAGYVGSVLVPRLLRDGHSVRVYDNFMYGQATLMDVVGDTRLEIVRADVRNLDALRNVMRSIDCVIHLASIVGAPACQQDPELSLAVNEGGTRNVLETAEACGAPPLLFPSTGSCYGAVPNGLCTEETPISPLSNYGAHKAIGEALVKRYTGPWTIFRFATVFGASPRPRLDLLINDLAYQAVTLKSLVIYEAGFRRTFIHVRDAARVFVWAVEGLTRDATRWQKLKQTVFNIGNPEMNLTKEEVARAIVKQVPGCLLNLAGEGKDVDARNYEVSYDRMTAAGFRCEVDFGTGLTEVFKSYRILRVANPYSNAG